ncbi:MAG: fibronectin type III domain-containing protein, partial [Bacteroidales bacterium]
MKRLKGSLTSALLKLYALTLFCFSSLTLANAQNSIYSDPVRISTDTSMISTMAACALDKNGHLHIIYVGWYYELGAPSNVASEIFYTNNRSGEFFQPEKLPKAELPSIPGYENGFYYSKEPTIAVDSGGTVHVAYYRTRFQLEGAGFICYTNNKYGDFSVPQILYYDPLIWCPHCYSFGKNIGLAVGPDNDSIHIVFQGNPGTGHGGALYSIGLNGNFNVPVTITQKSGDPTIKIDREGIPNILYWINSDTTDIFSSGNLAISKILGGRFSSPSILFESADPLESTFAIDQYDSIHVVCRHRPDFAQIPQMNYIRGIFGQFSPVIQLPTNTLVSHMYSIDVAKNQIEYIAYKQAADKQSLGFMYNDGSGFKDISPQDYHKYGFISAGPKWFALDKANKMGYFVFTTEQIELVQVDLRTPSIPLCIDQPNNATNVSITPIFSWYQSDRAIDYHIQVSATSDFSDIVVNKNNIIDTISTLSGLSYGKTYYWRINASGAGGKSDWSEIWNFTTVKAVGINTLSSEAGFQFYPNPVNNVLFL